MQSGDRIVTNDHREVEIKLRVDGGIEHTQQRLELAGFIISKARVFESNVLFDTPERKLREASQLLRLRRVGDRCTLTYKGAGAAGKHKSREEIETGVGDEANMALVFSRLGYAPVFRYEKFRTEYEVRGQGGVVTLDETPIGVYLEVEGEPAWIDRVAAILGFTEEQYITQSYAALYFEYCREHGVTPTNMVFESVV
jgi:adenylate cyclase class 2